MWAIVFSVIGSVCGAGQFNIVTYGAVGDGTTDNTKAFEDAVKACGAAGGGTVLVPRGNFLTNPFTIVAKMNLNLAEGASILAHPNPSDWPANSACFICGSGATGGSITGSGIIDGKGTKWWANPSEKRPNLLNLESSNNFLIEGVTFQNSPMFHIVPTKCTNMEIRGISILAPASPTSHNTDGIDPNDCDNLYIHNVYISNGDDNIAIKEGTQNVVVANSVFGTGHGASIGSVIGGTNQNITFRNISFTGTSAGVRIKTQPGCTGSVKNIVYEDLVFKDVDDMIVIDMFYTPGCGSAPTGIDISNIKIENISGTGTHVGYFNCSKNMHCTGITLSNVHIVGSNSNTFSCNNAYGTASGVSPASCLIA